MKKNNYQEENIKMKKKKTTMNLTQATNVSFDIFYF